jgi:hypothetical protein
MVLHRPIEITAFIRSWSVACLFPELFASRRQYGRYRFTLSPSMDVHLADATRLAVLISARKNDL